MGCEVRVIRFSLLLNLPIDVKIVHIPFYLTVLLITLFELKKNRKSFKRFLLSTAGDNELNLYQRKNFRPIWKMVFAGLLTAGLYPFLLTT